MREPMDAQHLPLTSVSSAANHLANASLPLRACKEPGSWNRTGRPLGCIPAIPATLRYRSHGDYAGHMAALKKISWRAALIVYRATPKVVIRSLSAKSTGRSQRLCENRTEGSSFSDGVKLRDPQ